MPDTAVRAARPAHPELDLDDAVSVIDGERIAGSGRRIDVIDATTLRRIGRVAEADEEMVDRAVTAARGAFAAWAGRGVTGRADVLLAVADHIEEHGARLATLVSCEMGMPLGLAEVTQWHLPAAVLRAAVREAEAAAAPEPIDGAVLVRRPVGVVAAINPWNMPIYQTMAKLAGALAAGCTVVTKPSAQTPYDAALLLELLAAAGLPAGVVNLVQGSGGVVGSALAAHPGVDHVSFTGSVEAGRTVARLAADHLAPCTLELGGKSPAVVLPGADLGRAVPAALRSGLVNSGQACNATTRILVPVDRAAEAEALIAAAAAELVTGDPGDPATTHGPLSSPAHGGTVSGFVTRALEAGGRLVTGGPGPLTGIAPGYFLPPTVIADLAPDAEAVQEEIFGPVVVLQTYRDVDDAVELANRTRFGLSAEVWGPEAEALAVAPRIRAGQVKVNGVRTRERPGVPFGGHGDSGYGRELGALGIREFLEVTAVLS